MYWLLLLFHSLFRWLVLLSLIYSIYIAFQGTVKKKVFTSVANAIRHWTATIVHVQLLIGMTLYFQSPVVSFQMAANSGELLSDQTFYRYVHISLMILATTIVTIGSAKAKRVPYDRDKYKTMLKWFFVAFLIIILAIPWPFSPFAARPYLRTF